MSDPTRRRISSAFEDELASAPEPPGLRALAIHGAVTAPRKHSNQPRFIALVAAILAVAVVATLVIGSHALRATPVPARPTGSLVPPSPRSGADLVYDQANRELVLFGGSTIENKVVNETWTWDGRLWTLHHTAAPPARHDGVMAYDAARHDVVLFGGMAQVGITAKAGQAPVEDTWTWNGSAWTEQHPEHQPVLGFDWPASMAFDPVTKTVLVFGFQKTTAENQTNMQAQTWSWNGSDWTQLTPSTTPIEIGQMVGGGTHVYLLALSAGRVGGTFVTQIWRWDGATWTLLPPTNDNKSLPSSVAYDTQRDQILAFNGDTWTWNGAGWTRQHPPVQPPAVGYMAYFAPLREVVSLGSLYGNTNNDLWAWDGTTWQPLAAGTAVPVPTPSGQLGPVAPAAAATFIRQTVTTTSPVLLPTWLPDGLVATAVATSDGFNIEYVSDQRDRRIDLGIVAANPPPGDQSSSDTWVRFRSSGPLKGGQTGYAEYFVYDTAAPTSDRWLMWSEGGSPKTGGVPYFLSASGLTDAEFWQVANSLR